MTLTPGEALSSIPETIKKPLVDEYNKIINNFMEHNWESSELSGGRFCEIVYTVLDGHAKGIYEKHPIKPNNFLTACRALESNSCEPRSFQILIPRLLPALYEIRSNRNVGHVGGDIDPDFMDSSLVVATSGWILAELIRVLHGISTEEAQKLVDNLSERRIPIIWKSGDRRRVLKAGLKLQDQILLLLSSTKEKVHINELLLWMDYHNKSYLKNLIYHLHNERLLEFYDDTEEMELLPPGREYISTLLATLDLK